MSTLFLPSGGLPNLQKLSFILGKPLTFLDLETTGMVHEHTFAIIEIGLIHINSDSVIEKNTFVNPRMRIPYHITQLTGIDDKMVQGKKDFGHYANYFQKISKNHVLCGYNSKSFDSKGVEKMLRQENIEAKFNDQLDVRYVFLKAKKIFEGISQRGGSLVEACKHHKVLIPGHAHRAGCDIAITALLAEKLIEKYGFDFLIDDIKKINCADTKAKFINYIKK